MAVREYVGARYVPLFADQPWTNTIAYEPLTVVLNEGNSYTSRQYVPVGIDISNENYWAETGNYNAQVEAYRKEVVAVKESVNSIIANHGYVQPEDYGAKADGVTDDTAAFQYAVNAAQDGGLTVLLKGNQYALNSTVEISKPIKFIGYNIMEYYPLIRCNMQNASAFHVTTSQACFYNICLDGLLNSNRTFVGIDFEVVGQNIDCFMEGVFIQGANIGMRFNGSNVSVKNCTFSNCHYGIHFIKGSSNTFTLRGLIVQNNRFHSIGSAQNYDGTSAGIRFDYEGLGVVPSAFISGNYSDIGDALVSGTIPNCTIVGNTVMNCYCTPFIFEAFTVTSDYSIVMQSNYVFGSLDHNFPKNVNIVVNNVAKLVLAANVFYNSTGPAVVNNASSFMSVNGNTFIDCPESGYNIEAVTSANVAGNYIIPVGKDFFKTTTGTITTKEQGTYDIGTGVPLNLNHYTKIANGNVGTAIVVPELKQFSEFIVLVNSIPFYCSLYNNLVTANAYSSNPSIVNLLMTYSAANDNLVVNGTASYNYDTNTGSKSTAGTFKIYAKID